MDGLIDCYRAYGKTITNLMKHTDVRFVNAEESKPLINSPRYKSLTELDDDLFEIEMAKSIIKWNLPNQVNISLLISNSPNSEFTRVLFLYGSL